MNEVKSKAKKRQNERDIQINEMNKMLEAGRAEFKDKHYLEIFDKLFN